MKQILFQRILKLSFIVIAGSAAGNAQSIGCYTRAVCVRIVNTCSCNGAEYTNTGFQSGHTGYSCDLFVGAPCASGGNCGQAIVTGITHEDGYCIGPAYPASGKQPVFDVNAELSKHESLDFAEKVRNTGGKTSDKCEIASIAFRTWIEGTLKRAR